MKKLFVFIIAAIMLVSFAGVSVSATGEEAPKMVEVYSENFDGYENNTDAFHELEIYWQLVAAGGSKWGDEYFGINEDGQLILSSFNAIRWNTELGGAYELSFDYAREDTGNGSRANGNPILLRNSLTDGTATLYEVYSNNGDGASLLGKSGIGLYFWGNYCSILVRTFDDVNYTSHWDIVANDINVGGTGFQNSKNPETIKVVDNGKDKIEIYCADKKFVTLTLSEEKEVCPDVEEYMAYTKVTAEIPADIEYGYTEEVSNALVASIDTASFAFCRRPIHNKTHCYYDNISLSMEKSAEPTPSPTPEATPEPTAPPTNEPDQATAEPGQATEAPGNATAKPGDAPADTDKDAEEKGGAPVGIIIGVVAAVVVIAVVVVIVIKKKK